MRWAALRAMKDNTNLPKLSGVGRIRTCVYFLQSNKYSRVHDTLKRTLSRIRAFVFLLAINRSHSGLNKQCQEVRIFFGSLDINLVTSEPTLLVKILRECRYTSELDGNVGVCYKVTNLV